MLRAARALLPVLLAAAPPPAESAPAPPARGHAGPLAAERYADALAGMSAEARARESRPAAPYVYCLRATAVYEHLSYGRGAKLRHHYVTKVRHGTGFAYRRRGAEWLVATNHHVVQFPEVTGDGTDLEGVPAGARRIRQDVRIVSSEAEPDRPDQPPLALVVEDELLDIAVLASRRPLDLVPYRFGRSADLRVGNAVLVRGFPLGAFPAANAGRVIGVGQRDLERGWDHEDFAVDALLNLGSSGSPVLAVVAESGEPEIVGVYHAGYKGAQGLNVVIAIDGLRPLLEGLTRVPRPAPERVAGASPGDARAVLARGPLVMPFGGRAVRVDRAGEAVRFGLLDATFPLSDRVEVTIVDRGAPASGRAAELRDALWEQLGLVVRYRAAEGADEGRSTLRDRIAARLREREPDQEELLAAVRAGADGLAAITYGERDPAARASSDDGRLPAARTPVVVLGAK
ncbi:MAG TPA: serine protease [Anaeromyxobacter sp.]|nr:serine protease [Anaeromyxobacter sp.]